MQYADEPTPLNLGREFVSLADSERGVWLQFPTLKRHLFEYPSAGPGTTDLVYWSKERVGRRTFAAGRRFPDGLRNRVQAHLRQSLLRRLARLDGAPA